MGGALRDFIRIYDNVVDQQYCDIVIKKFERDTKYHTKNAFSAEYDDHLDSFGGSRHEDVSKRSFTEINVGELQDKNNPNNWIKIQKRFTDVALEYVKQYKKDCNVRFPKHFKLETVRLKKYTPGGDEFSDHVDVTRKWSSTRFLVVFGYLNTVAEGGQTRFSAEDYAVKPVAGRLLMFPPFWLFPHAGLRPISGPKYILGTYLHYFF